MRTITVCFAVCLSLIISNLDAQERGCGTMDLYKTSLDENPHLHKTRNQIEEFTRNSLGQKGASEVVFIPVVVHVVYRTAAENISIAQVQSQIDVLNEDFGRTNSDASQTPSQFQGVADDMDIRFCLAQRDPSGQATNGITRTQTDANSFGLGGAVKSENTGGKSAWPSDQYLNIWVCNLSSPLLGFATLPGSAAPGQDGVVIDYTNFGRTGAVQAPYNRGRTGTHEVGHWLNLLHIWGDDENSSDNCAGSDQVSDTPNQGGFYLNCPAANSSSCGSADMFMNYMDYVDDDCMNLFTRGQKERMFATLNGFRSSIRTSPGCSAPPVANGCDTLNNITGGDGLVYYFSQEINANDTGYLTGTNSVQDLAFAEKFSSQGEKAIYGARFDFAIASEGAPGAFVRILLYDVNESGDAPGDILTQTSFPLADIENNVNNFTFTDVEFPNPVNVNGDYFLGFEAIGQTGDTIAIYTNQFDKINVNSAFVKRNSGEWFAFNDPEGFDGSLSLAIRSIQCSTVGIEEKRLPEIKVFPNPSQDGNFTLEITKDYAKASYEFISIEGKLKAKGVLSTDKIQSFYFNPSPGMYFLRILPLGAQPQVIPLVISSK